MAIIDTKIAALQTILPTIDSQKFNDLQNFQAGTTAGIFTQTELSNKVDELEVFVKEYYGLIPQTNPITQLPIDAQDLSDALEHGFSVEDGIEGHYNLKRFGEVIFQIKKTIGKNDFQNIIEANKIKRIVPPIEETEA